ncbi:uncharacterized protein [Coffea arabica]|uniref:Uncharacterized protein isoform X1 n=1 Tax=Coffea arabica TaxID=13443 RepID=A0ABM4WAY0_COFAR
MAANIPYFDDRLDFVPEWGYETHVFPNDQWAVANCGTYFDSGYSTDTCPVFQDNLSTPLDTFGDFPPQYQTQYDPYSNGCDQEWWDNSNFDYATGQMDFQQQESQQSSSVSGMSLEEMMELLIANTNRFHQETQASLNRFHQETQASLNQFHQETQASFRDLADQLCLLTSEINQVASQIEELPSKTVVDLEENESAICLTGDEEMQECQNEKSTDAVEKEAEKEEMEPQPQPIQVKESSEQSPNAVTSPPLLHQYSPDSYSSIPVNEIDFIIPDNFEFHDRNKLRVAMARYLEPINANEGGVNGECKLSSTRLAPFTSPWKPVTRMLKDYSIYEGYQDYIEDEALRRATRFYPP